MCAVFPLLWVGGLVTTTDSGMAVPDWPTTYGYNLFLYPWQTWILGPIGALIAVPMTMAVQQLVLQSSDSSRWLSDLMGAGSPADEEEDVAKETAGSE